MQVPEQTAWDAGMLQLTHSEFNVNISLQQVGATVSASRKM